MKSTVKHEALRRVLAFDCSGASCSAAVVEDGRVLAERFAAMERGQAEALVPMIGAVMTEAGLDFSVLDALATTVGPGSFTGIRLGLAAGHGLALAAGKPFLGVTSFEAHLAGLEAQARNEQAVAVVIDSRRGPVFFQIFDAEGRPLGTPAQVEPGDLPDLLPHGRTIVIGDGTALLPAPFTGPPGRIQARHVALLASGRGPEATGGPAPRPLYLRPPDVTMPRAAGR